MSTISHPLPYASISLDQLERVARRLSKVPDTRWEWRANDLTDSGGRQIVESSPSVLVERLRQGRIRPDSIGIEAFPAQDSQWVDGREVFEVRADDGVRYHFSFRVGINRKPGKQNYVSHIADVALAERAAADIVQILGEYPRRRSSKFLLQHRGRDRWVGSTHFWTVVGAVGALLAIIVALWIHFDESDASEPSSGATTSSAAPTSAATCVDITDEKRLLSEVTRRLDRDDRETRARLMPVILSAVAKACATSDSGVDAKMQVVCGFGYTDAPQTYCDAYDEVAEPEASLSAKAVGDAFATAGLKPLAVRPTTESFSTIVFVDQAAADRGAGVARFTDYSTQASGTATRPICNVVFVPFVGAQNNTHANAMRTRLEGECERTGSVSIDYVGRLTTALTRLGSPNCCDPNYPKPESLARAVVIGAGGLPDQAEVGIAHVILFPDQLTTREYLSWYEQASEDGGDGGYLSDPVLRACNAVVRSGGGVSSPEKEVDQYALRRIAELLAEVCGGQVDVVGGKRERR